RGLLLEEGGGKVPADGKDRGGPGDAGAAPEGARPAAIHVATMRGENTDDAPVRLGACLAVNAEAGHAPQPVGPGRPQATAHVSVRPRAPPPAPRTARAPRARAPARPAAPSSAPGGSPPAGRTATGPARPPRSPPGGWRRLLVACASAGTGSRSRAAQTG